MNEMIRFRLEAMTHVNYAGYANSMNIIRRLTIENHLEEDLTDAELTITFIPALAKSQTIAIPRLPAKKSVEVGSLDGAIDAEFILSLTESVPVEMKLELTGKEFDFEEKYPIQVEPYEQWSGYEEMPELLAAYAIPHHPAIKNLLVRSGELFKDLTGIAALDGYEVQDPNWILQQISAIYSAVAERGISYIAPPGDYLRTGKRIRLTDEVIEKGYGDSLDLALLFVGLLEAASLNPLLILQEQTCKVGVWLNNEVFPETVNYDSTSISKRMARGMHRIAVFDPLSAVAGADFNQALAKGAQELEDWTSFVMSLDLKRARLVGIKPLPVRVLEGGKYVIAPHDLANPLAAVLPEELSVVDGSLIPVPKQMSKQTVWERKLLDLSLRNSLINYRPERSGILLAVHNLDMFVRDLLEEQTFHIMHQPADWSKPGDFKLGSDSSALLKLAAQEYESGVIRAFLNEEMLDHRGEKLVKGARSSLEETGANSLYLGIGTLMWYSRQDPETLRQAPLILMPVDCEDKGHRSGLLLKAREEEGHFNITLIQMLKNDFGISLEGLDPLPTKDGSIDVLGVFSRVRSAILQEKKWDVHEAVNLGLFSFSKFIMWRDLKDNLTQFSSGKLVSSLMAGKLNAPFEPIELTSDFIDEVPANDQIIYPVSSDASQSLAVLAATQGKTFVLHGPPGTGKSQTITNIIANALMQNKRVLFVAQKMAALEVVERRLNNIGIGAFCLELHSNKARKKAVLDQLEQSMKIQRISKNASYEKEKEEVRRRKSELNEIIKRLHKVDESGYSIYELITEYSSLKDFPKFLELPAGFNTGGLSDKQEALEHLTRMGAYAGGPYGHPLRGIGRIKYRPLLKEEIASACEMNLTDLSVTLDKLTRIDPSLTPKTFVEATQLAMEGRAVLELFQIAPTLLAGDLSVIRQEILRLLDETQKAEQTKNGLLNMYAPEFLDADPQRLERDFNLFEGKPTIGKLFRKNPVEKELALYARKGVVQKEEILNHLEALKQFQAQEAFLRQSQMTVEKYWPSVRKENSTRLEEILSKVTKIEEQISDSVQLELMTHWVAQPGFESQLQAYEKALSSQGPDLVEFLKLTAFEEEELEDYEGNYFQKISGKMTEFISGLDRLRDWIMYRQAREMADEMDLALFTRYYHDGHVSDRELILAFKKSVVRYELMKRLEEEQLLLNSTGHGLDEKAAELKERLIEMEVLERKELYYHLASKIPNLVLEKATSREIAILQRALRSGARNLSIRKLFSETDNLLRQIAPCMLMSPMSVAQYLKPEADLFDLVVFDEASQIPTAEAIGALGRGTEAIIVGDPKQLPPTSFFMTQSNGTDEPEEFQDLDNILEDALALSLPESYLLWHYRSRHESLISFSNRNFYDGKLFTYPSPDDMVSKVTMRKNDGVYERGTGRVNRLEAAQVVDEVVRRMQDPNLAKQSIGIVTFSVVQQNLIEELLQNKINENNALELALNAMSEPLFIKNLENVQGDERDVILFSVGYGPDEKGRLTMNFGPLNQEGGWRRLNVAVSRSRLEMMVFTNIDLNKFNVSSSTARGVRDLRAFLEFAQRPTRTLMLDEIRQTSVVTNLDGLIAERLRERGWTVETSIGTSRFKVDLGIVDPKNPNRFILGVMCGGESTRTAQAAYDREILQKSILEGLGWEIHRVFAMDWLENEELVIDELIRRAEDILIMEQRKISGESESPRYGISEEPAGGDATMTATRAIPYRTHDVKSRQLMLNEFLKVTNATLIGAELKEIVETEGPISRTLLAKRAKSLFGLSRVTPKMEQHLELIMNKVRPVMTLAADIPVYWPDGKDPSTYDNFRRTLPDDLDRELGDIAPEEVLSALREVLTKPQSERELIQKTAEILGHPQLSIDKERWLQSILNIGVLDGKIKREANGTLVGSEIM